MDNLIKGNKKAVLGGKLCVGDIRDINFIDDVFKHNDIDSVIHFVANIEVGLSMKEPLEY